MNLAEIKKCGETPQPWIIHGFTGKPELAEQLLKQEFYFSFGKSLLQEQNPTGFALTETPFQRLFLETDATDSPISMIYASAAKILGDEISRHLQQQILINFQRVFLHD